MHPNNHVCLRAGRYVCFAERMPTHPGAGLTFSSASSCARYCCATLDRFAQGGDQSGSYILTVGNTTRDSCKIRGGRPQGVCKPSALLLRSALSKTRLAVRRELEHGTSIAGDPTIALYRRADRPTDKELHCRNFDINRGNSHLGDQVDTLGRGMGYQL